MIMSRSRLSLTLSLAFWFMFMSCLFHVVRPQNLTRRATTDPEEARALNNIFRKWNITATKDWNISGQLCSGVAIQDSVVIDTKTYNPLIKCDCSFNDSTIFRIVALKARSMNIAVPIPDDLWTLVHISNLRIMGSGLSGPIPSSFSNLNNLEELGM